jgi:predicted nucleotidyltransferase
VSTFGDCNKKEYFWFMIIKEEILKQVTDFTTLCQTHKVRYLYVFGSSTTDKFNNDTSDIDLLVEIDDPDPIERGEKLLSLWDSFEIFFHRKVDLLTDSSIRNPYLRKSIDSTKILIYDGKRSKVFV